MEDSCNRNNFFFIKSKHVLKTYHNHDYFQSNANKNISFSEKVNAQSKEFVNEPTSYGINNTHKYICGEILRNSL
jgi:hypothetical protein